MWITNKLHTKSNNLRFCHYDNVFYRHCVFWACYLPDESYFTKIKQINKWTMNVYSESSYWALLTISILNNWLHQWFIVCTLFCVLYFYPISLYNREIETCCKRDGGQVHHMSSLPFGEWRLAVCCPLQCRPCCWFQCAPPTSDGPPEKPCRNKHPFLKQCPLCIEYIYTYISTTLLTFSVKHDCVYYLFKFVNVFIVSDFKTPA